jgi:hypothetical protein
MVAVIPQVYPIPLEFLGQIPGLPTRDQLDFIPSAQIEKAGARGERHVSYVNKLVSERLICQFLC